MFTLQNLCTRGLLLEKGRQALDDGIGPVIARYLASVHDQPGEVTWDSPEAAPGDDGVRLKAVRVVCEGEPSGIVSIDREVRIEIEYWNLEPAGRRIVGVNVYTATGICAVSSCNVPSASLDPDPWFEREYPPGLFRTVCRIPARLLNDGLYSVTLAIHGRAVGDRRVWMEHAISFTVRDTRRDDYTGHFISAVRPLLGWRTERLT
jgi:lipopolysaccharide transport system ATP-binding protein